MVVVAGGVAARADSEPLPTTSARVLLASTIRLPGPPAELAWPADGEAALATPTGQMIGSSGPDATIPIASIAKVMTAYVILTDHPLATGQGGPAITITASEAAHLPARRAAGESLLGIHSGETLNEYQDLQALLIASADNIAAALARFDAGTLAAFVAEMNATANTLGMHHTHFVDPSGFDAGSVSNPTDLIKLARAAMAIPVFAAIVGQRSAAIPGVAILSNYNTLVGTDGFVGIKTGSTGPAGEALLFSVTRTVDGRSIGVLGVVLQQRGGAIVSAALAAAKSLVNSFYSHLAERTVFAASTSVVALSRAGRRSTIFTIGLLQVIALPATVARVTVTVGNLKQRNGVIDGTVAAVSSTGYALVATRGQIPVRPGLRWRLGHVLF